MKLSTHGFSTTELTSSHGNKPTRICLQKLEGMGLTYEMYTDIWENIISYHG
jgi:hypothetical protein